MKEQTFVAGVGMTSFGKHLDKSIKDLVRIAVEQALADAGCDKSQIQAAFFSNCTQGHFEGQHMVRGEIALRAMGIQKIPVVNVENACASASTAFHLAVMYVNSGAADIALAVGAEKMLAEDKALMFAAFDSAWDVHDVEKIKNDLLQMGSGVTPPAGSTSPKPYSVFMDVYAAMGRQHIREYGTTQRQFAAVAAKNHGHSVHNPLSQYQKAFSIEEVMASPPITYPMTLLMCAPVTDGGAAAIVCNEAGLRRLSGNKQRAVKVLASVIQTGSDRPAAALELHAVRQGSQKAYELAGIGPKDVSVAEVHDATAIGEIVQSEVLGLCEMGMGGVTAERGETTLGG
ncbi:MAG: thiolase family protein, partial [Proteobacteria bacterium]|nr:thiolase family protein [Pseudomonadota bacterium]